MHHKRGVKRAQAEGTKKFGKWYLRPVAVVQENLIQVGVPPHDFSGIAAHEHGQIGTRKPCPEEGQHGECEDNIAKAVGADDKNPAVVTHRPLRILYHRIIYRGCR
jgi:hypothetical protein